MNNMIINRHYCIWCINSQRIDNNPFFYERRSHISLCADYIVDTSGMIVKHVKFEISSVICLLEKKISLSKSSFLF